jgi:hypothetical protein
VASDTKTQLVTALQKQLRRAAKAHAQSREFLDRAADLAATEGDDGNGEEGEEPQVDGQPVAQAEDWVRLAKLCGVAIATLQRRVSSPSECKLVVSRESPTIYEGQKIFCGEFPELTQEFPFDLPALKNSIANRYGGELWKLSIQDASGRVIRDMVLRIAITPRNPGPLEEEGGSDGGVALLPEGVVPAPVDEFDQEMEGMLQMEKRRARLAAIRKSRMEMENELPVSRTDEKLDRVISALSGRGHDNGGGQMAVLLQAIQAQAAQQSDSLKLVLSSIGDKLSHSQDSQLKMFDVMAKMMEARASAQAEITKIQMESKKAEMDMIMKVVAERREEREMGMDKMLELLQIGMDLKRGGAEGEGEKGDWLTSLVSSVGTLITNQATGQLKLPGGEQPVAPQAPPTPAEAEAQRAEIERMANEAARRIALKFKARREALQKRAAARRAALGQPPPPPPAPAPPAPDQQRQALWTPLVTEILELAIIELEELPPRSEAVQLCFEKAPQEWRDFLVTHNDVREIGAFFRPYANEELLAQARQLLAGNEKRQEWLMAQGGILRNALIKMHEARAAAPPPGASAPAGAEPVPEEEEPEAPEPDVEHEQEQGGPADA